MSNRYFVDVESLLKQYPTLYYNLDCTRGASIYHPTKRLQQQITVQLLNKLFLILSFYCPIESETNIPGPKEKLI